MSQATQSSAAMGIATATAAALISAGCSTWQQPAEAKANEQAARTPASIEAAAELGASHVAEIPFDKNSWDLNANARQSLARMMSDVRANGSVADVKVIAWSDSEYPAKKQKQLSKKERELAERRATMLEDFLKQNLKVADIDTYNMAERPNTLENLFDTSDARLKRALEVAGLPTTADGKASQGKASRAVIMVIMNEG